MLETTVRVDASCTSHQIITCVLGSFIGGRIDTCSSAFVLMGSGILTLTTTIEMRGQVECMSVTGVAVVELRVVVEVEDTGEGVMLGDLRGPTIPDVVAWLREQGAIDYGAATNITRELTSHLPADFEGSYDATVWTLNIVDAALRVEGE